MTCSQELGLVVDWDKVDKEDYLLAMERSPVKDLELKLLLKVAQTDKVNGRSVYMKGIDAAIAMRAMRHLKLKNSISPANIKVMIILTTSSLSACIHQQYYKNRDPFCARLKTFS